MDILIANLHEYGAGVGQEIAGHGEAVAEVGKITMNAVAPSVPKCFNLLRLASDMAGVDVIHVADGGRALEVAVEFNAVRRIEIDALDFSPQSFALG